MNCRKTFFKIRNFPVTHFYKFKKFIVAFIIFTFILINCINNNLRDTNLINCSICRGNLTTISGLLHLYLQKHGHFPPAFVVDNQGRPMHSWRVLVLESAGHPLQTLYNKFDLDEPWNSPRNSKLIREMPKFYACPNRHRGSIQFVTNYVGIVGPQTVFPNQNSVSLEDIHDNIDTTLQIAEIDNSEIYWSEPNDLTITNDEIVLGNARPAKITSGDLPGPGFLFVDGRIRRSAKRLEYQNLSPIITINGNEVMSKEFSDFFPY